MFWNAGGHMGLMGLWWIVIVAVLITVVWVAATAGRAGGSRNSSAEERLKERYVAGEIDRATYERTLADLRR